MAANSNKILHDFPVPLMFRHFKDGRIERYAGTDVVPVSLDSKTVVQSKDDDISLENVSARLYLPADATQEEKLPIIVYFHGGGFVMESTFSPLFHKHLNLFVAEASRYSVGGNIAHYMAIRIKKEASDSVLSKSFVDRLLLYVCPSDKGCNDTWIHPERDLVYVGEKDILKDRAWYYKEASRKSGRDGNIEVVEVKGEDHVFGVFFPDSENAFAMLKTVTSFINS
ncbi:hypothetical protein BUALT_Bualt15G0035000 [Buddleja alternifolia]|uniref:Alpha/beta hydrolase fold-3 domain-containing protein n=1 Tax=Buddleja alternifolia TaxID=168488 RepID=A0AAV6WAB7_9LAMI|nr:hypothetical protein BUALT_Bualt15G0035000 [Buddleja alternifolia]